MWEISYIAEAPLVSVEGLVLFIMMWVSNLKRSSACDGATEVSGLAVLVETEELIDVRLDLRAVLQSQEITCPSWHSALERCNFLCHRNSEASETGRGWVNMYLSPNLSIRVVQLVSVWEAPGVP
jgi:hypothetical protein